MYFSDITAEHASQAAFLYQTRRRLECSWIVEAGGLDRFDQQVAAHLSGILGDLATEQERLLAMAAAGDSGYIYSCCALWLLSHRAWPDELKQAVLAGDGGLGAAAAAVQTLEPSEGAGLVRAWLEEDDPALLGTAIAAAHDLGVQPGESLQRVLASEHSALREAGLELAGSLRLHEAAPGAEAALDSEDAAIRYQGARWLALTGSGEARAALQSCLGEACGWRALRLLATVLSAEACRDLAGELAREPSTRRYGARLAGYAGLVQMIDGLIRLMEEPWTAPFAAEALGLITSLDYARQGLVASEGHYDAEEAYVGEGFNLPQPDPEAVAAWWEDNQRHYPAGDEQWLLGQRRSAERLAEVINRDNEHARAFATMLLAQEQPEQPLTPLCGFSAHLPRLSDPDPGQASAP